MARRHELADAQRELIDGLLPGKAGDPGRTAADNRLFVNAVLFVLRAAIPWEDLPERHGKHNPVWRRFDRRCAGGRVGTPGRGAGRPGPGGAAAGLHDGQGPPRGVDRAAAAAAGGKKEEAHDRRRRRRRRRRGRGRGGLSTELHAAAC